MLQKGPQGIELADNVTGQFSGIGLIRLPQRQGEEQIRVEKFPLSRVRWGLGKTHQFTKPGTHDVTEAFDVDLVSLRQRIGIADQVCQAGLPFVDPVLVNPVTVADQDAVPVLHQILEGLLGSVIVDAIQGDLLVDPWPRATLDRAL